MISAVRNSLFEGAEELAEVDTLWESEKCFAIKKIIAMKADKANIDATRMINTRDFRIISAAVASLLISNVLAASVDKNTVVATISTTPAELKKLSRLDSCRGDLFIEEISVKVELIWSSEVEFFKIEHLQVRVSLV